jgi:hypothetical protein
MKFSLSLFENHQGHDEVREVPFACHVLTNDGSYGVGMEDTAVAAAFG